MLGGKIENADYDGEVFWRTEGGLREEVGDNWEKIRREKRVILGMIWISLLLSWGLFINLIFKSRNMTETESKDYQRLKQTYRTLSEG